MADFAAVAARLCTLLESDPKDREVWVEQVLAALARVYAYAHDLPSDRNGEDAEDFDQFDVTDDEWKQVYQRIQRALREQTTYWAYFDPSEPMDADAESVCGDLADDLADIYRDLKPGVRAWERGAGSYVTDILLGWKFPSFDSHWGLHAVSAMRALHPVAHLRGLQNSTDG